MVPAIKLVNYLKVNFAEVPKLAVAVIKKLVKVGIDGTNQEKMGIPEIKDIYSNDDAPWSVP